MHGVEAAHAEAAEAEAAHVVGHGGHPAAGLEAPVHVGVRPEGLGEGCRVRHLAAAVSTCKQWRVKYGGRYLHKCSN